MLPKHWRVGAFYYRAFTAEEKSLLPVKLATLGISIRAPHAINPEWSLAGSNPDSDIRIGSDKSA